MEVPITLCLLLTIVLVPLSSTSPILGNYDIWNDGLNNLTATKNLKQHLNRTSKVLNFFPVPVEDECNSLDGRRKGICMNTYECRIQGGASSGLCALGFGVCCVFTATCGYEVINNITYFTNPSFPDITREMSSCELKIKKVDPEIAQLRLDFIHFHLGQPNRNTGICDQDSFLLTGGSSKDIKLCGFNSGQHVYYDIENTNDPITIKMSMGKFSLPRMWEVRVLQVPFAERAPTGCMQYFTGTKGVIQTFNFATNGRRLAGQEYNICTRQEVGMCSIAYEPCHENAFRIGSGPRNSTTIFRPTNNGGSNTGSNTATTSGGGGENGAAGGQTEGENTQAVQADEGEAETGEENPEGDVMMDVGSGDGAETAPASAPAQAASTTTRRRGKGRSFREIREFRETCPDRIVMPCDSDNLMPVNANSGGLGFCDVAHCGSSLCAAGEIPCRIESNVTPFTIGVQFQDTAPEEPADDNLGMCLTYEQLPCT